ncbi:MAG: PAS domain-containing sensor histidine kinase, partial [Lysobacteraceae bacterium]
MSEFGAREPELFELTTPVLWADASGIVQGCNPAFAHWLAISARRLEGINLATLDTEDGRLAELLQRATIDGSPLRMRRARLRATGAVERFADLIVVRDANGLRIEAHPADEFPGADPASALPAALHAALKGLAHEIR